MVAKVRTQRIDNTGDTVLNPFACAPGLTFWLASGGSDCPMPDGPHHAKLKSKNWGPRMRGPDVVSTKGQHLCCFQAEAPARAIWEATRT